MQHGHASVTITDKGYNIPVAYFPNLHLPDLQVDAEYRLDSNDNPPTVVLTLSGPVDQVGAATKQLLDHYVLSKHP